MWFHKTGRFAVGDNGESSIYVECGVHSEYLKLINCVNNIYIYARHKKTSKAAVSYVYSVQGFK